MRFPRVFVSLGERLGQAGVATDVLVDPAANLIAVSNSSYSVARDGFTQIPTELSINVISASEMSPDGSLAAIRFFPNGGSSGGEIALFRHSGSGIVFVLIGSWATCARSYFESRSLRQLPRSKGF